MTAKLATRVYRIGSYTYAMEVRDEAGALIAESPENPDARICRQWLRETYPTVQESMR